MCIQTPTLIRIFIFARNFCDVISARFFDIIKCCIATKLLCNTFIQLSNGVFLKPKSKRKWFCNEKNTHKLNVDRKIKLNWIHESPIKCNTFFSTDQKLSIEHEIVKFVLFFEPNFEFFIFFFFGYANKIVTCFLSKTGNVHKFQHHPLSRMCHLWFTTKFLSFSDFFFSFSSSPFSVPT